MNLLSLFVVTCLALASTASAAEFSAPENANAELLAKVEEQLAIAEQATSSFATFTSDIVLPVYEDKNYRLYPFPERLTEIDQDLQKLQLYRTNITEEKERREQEAVGAVAETRAKLDEYNRVVQILDDTTRGNFAAALKQRNDDIVTGLIEAKKMLRSVDNYTLAWNNLLNEQKIFYGRLEKGELEWKAMLEEMRTTCAGLNAGYREALSYHSFIRTAYCASMTGPSTIISSDWITNDAADSLVGGYKAKKAILIEIRQFLRNTFLPDINDIKLYMNISETDISTIVNMAEEVHIAAKSLDDNVANLLTDITSSILTPSDLIKQRESANK